MSLTKHEVKLLDELLHNAAINSGFTEAFTVKFGTIVGSAGSDEAQVITSDDELGPVTVTSGTLLVHGVGNNLLLANGLYNGQRVVVSLLDTVGEYAGLAVGAVEFASIGGPTITLFNSTDSVEMLWFFDVWVPIAMTGSAVWTVPAG